MLSTILTTYVLSRIYYKYETYVYANRLSLLITGICDTVIFIGEMNPNGAYAFTCDLMFRVIPEQNLIEENRYNQSRLERRMRLLEEFNEEQAERDQEQARNDRWYLDSVYGPPPQLIM